MLDKFGSSIQSALSRFKGKEKLTEDNIADGMREIRRALLEADVNIKVAKEFVKKVKEKSLGERVTLGLLDAWYRFFRAGGSIVVFQAQVCDQVFTAHPAQRVLEFHQLDEDIVLGVQALGCHR